jgi:hypothetical protein
VPPGCIVHLCSTEHTYMAGGTFTTVHRRDPIALKSIACADRAAMQGDCLSTPPDQWLRNGGLADTQRSRSLSSIYCTILYCTVYRTVSSEN